MIINIRGKKTVSLNPTFGPPFSRFELMFDCQPGILRKRSFERPKAWTPVRELTNGYEWLRNPYCVLFYSKPQKNERLAFFYRRQKKIRRKFASTSLCRNEVLFRKSWVAMRRSYVRNFKFNLN